MNKVFQIFKRDLSRLLHNPVAMVITIGVCIIPSLYAWYNIVANWDPYGNTANIKVAIANNDRGTSNEYVGELNAGKEVVDQLKENDQLGWTFVDAAEAKEGVERGDYYAAIIIPKDFSENLTSMITGTYTQPKLTYYVNEKKSAIAPKVTDTGANTIEQQINATFVSTVSKTLVEKMQDLGNGAMDKGGEASDSLLGKVQTANAGVGDVRTSLSNMTGTIDSTKDAITKADATLSSLSGQLPSLTKALKQGDTLLASTRETARNLHASLSSALSQGGVLLGQASAQANAGIGKVTGTITSAQAKVDGALTDVQGMIDTNNKIIEAIENTDFGSDTINQNLKQLAADLKKANAELQNVKDGLQTQSDDIKGTAGAIGDLSSTADTAVQTGIGAMNTAQGTLNSTALPQLSSGLDSFSAVSGDLTGVISGLTPSISQARGTLAQLSSTLDQAKTTLAETDSTLAKVQDSLSKVETDIAALRSSQAVEDLSELLGMDADKIADFMSSPVELTTKTVYPVKTYGSGAAPFYTNLALWVGGFVLIAIYKLEVDREGLGTFSATQAYFGRWLLMIVLGAVQATIVCVGDLVLGMQCTAPVLFVLAGIWISFVYVNLIYALAITFKHIGKAIAVILVIVQIPGSSGMYPIEMMPEFYNRIHPLLPFTYGIAAMRETIGGLYGLHYLQDLAILALFLVVAFAVGVWLRPSFLNLNLLFDRQLSRTGVLICEKNDLPRERFSLRAAMRALIDVKAFRADLVQRAARFEHRYPYLIKAGFLLVFGLPVLLFVLTSVLDLDVDGKILMLVLWIAAVILADTYMIVVEYVRESLNTQMRVSALSDDNLRAEIRSHADDFPRGAMLFGVNQDGGSGTASVTADDAEAAAEATAQLPAIGNHARRTDVKGGGSRA